MTYEKKFEFTGVEQTLQFVEPVILKQIRARQDISRHGVKTGDVGGFIEDEDCLSHFGDAWVANDAMVLASSTVSGDALVKDSARLYENCYLHGEVVVSGNAKVYSSNIQGDDVVITKNAVVEKSKVNASGILLTDNCHLENVELQAPITNLLIGGNAKVFADYETIKTRMKGENIQIKGDVELLNVRKVFGENVTIQGNALLDCVDINGNNVLIEDAVTVNRYITIESDVTLSDCVTLTARYGGSVSNIKLNGDCTYRAETLT